MSQLPEKIPIPPRGQVSIGVHYEVTAFGARFDLILRRLDPVSIADLVHALLCAASYVCTQNKIVDMEEQGGLLQEQWQRLVDEGVNPTEEPGKDAN